MSQSCKLSPSIKKREGNKVKEVDSLLFKDIKKAIKDYETSWDLWAYTKTNEFKEKYPNVEYDELGEVTFPSLIQAIGFKDLYDKQKDIEDVEKEYGLTNAKFKTSQEAVHKMNNLNRKEKNFIATVEKNGDEYVLAVSEKNAGSVVKAKEQSYNYALTEEIIGLLRELGFDVSFVSDPKFEGLFDPRNAKLYNGLLQIIKIAKGEVGERALPEEFSHLIIEGLINHPLVQRLLASITDGQVKEVLGEDMDRYEKLYDNDPIKLKKEAAGKLLAQHIKKEGTISQKTVREKRTLLSKIWNWAKNLFAKITRGRTEQAEISAYRAIEDIYKLVASREVINIIDKEAIIKGDELYKLQQEFSDIEKVATMGEQISAKMYRLNSDSMSKKERANAIRTIKNIRERIAEDRPELGVQEFLRSTVDNIIKITNSQQEAQKNEEEGSLTTIEQINDVAKIVREIDAVIEGYKPIIEALSTFGIKENIEQLGLKNYDIGGKIADEASSCLTMINSLEQWKRNTTINIILKAARTVYASDVANPFAKDKEHEVMALTTIIEHADTDINYVDRWLSALSDSNDPLLVIFDALVKTQQYERDMELIEWRAKIAVEDKKLRDAGYTSEFMLELGKDGKPNGRIISEYDWDTYTAELDERIKRWREEGKKGKELHTLIQNFKRGTDNNHNRRLIPVFVNPEYERMKKEGRESEIPPDAVTEDMPNPEVYRGKRDVIENLPDPQKKYYYAMMEIKRTMMAKIPHIGKGNFIYKAINISQDFIDDVLDSSSGNPVEAVWEHYRKKFTKRADDIGFGSTDDYKESIQDIIETESDAYQAAKNIIEYLEDTLDEDVKAILVNRDIKNIILRSKDKKEATKAVLEYIASKNFIQVDTDFANHRIQKLPVYYTRPLKDKTKLSKDFSGCLLAFSAMAVNYEKMNQVVDILEVTRDHIKSEDGRQLRESESGKPLLSRYTVLQKAYTAFINKVGSATNIAGRIDDYMESAVYEVRKGKEGSVEVMGVKLDVSKTLDAIKDYTGVLGLGFNLFSAISNIAVGKLQMWIEANAGEHFNYSDYALAVWQYNSLITGCVSEMGSPIKKNKLSLLIEMFDPMGEYYEGLRNPNFNNSKIARILGDGVLAYIGMNAGEHMLHCQTMLAILNHTKVINTKTNEKVSLFDALEVKEKDGVYSLEFNDDYAYERDVIDNTGNPETNKNYGRPLKDEQGKIKTERINLGDIRSKNARRFLIKRKRYIRKVNNSLNGAFNVNDKGALHKWAIGRLILQFRQWMPAHYERRFGKAHYDADLEIFREGYWRTVGGVLREMGKDIKKAQFQLLTTHTANLSEHEKANLRRANAEVAEFLVLLFLIRLGGRVKDRDRSWLNKMALYQVHRMYLEVGASMPSPGFLSNIFQLMRSPAATVNTFEKFNKILKFWNMFDEIQTGRFQGWSEWERDLFKLVPALDQITKVIYFDYSLFSMFENDD